jgi:hypothetical protein
MLEESNPMFYNGFKDKLKYFQPAFHALTPEGLNSRLTFLQQCMRPGDTIPTVQESGGARTLLYNDAQNSAFGAPPICILRFGDFFHTKIAIDTLTIGYKDAILDLNPEGIGVQPMIAEVSISFNFIGGHGLKEPVSRLQNALSFNYYANTEIYDDRAEVTDKGPIATDEQIAELFENLGINQNRNDENEAGEPIGTVIDGGYNIATNVAGGTIQYTKFMGDLPKLSQSYLKTTYDSLKKLNDDLWVGGLQIISNDRLYVSGNTDSKTTTIFGTPSKVQTKVKTLFKMTSDDVDNDRCPILANLGVSNYTNLLAESDRRKVKRKIKNMIDDRKNDYLLKLNDSITKINSIELQLIKQIDKANFVSSSRDGYKSSSGNYFIYETYDNTSGALTTLKSDLNLLRTQLNLLITNLTTTNIIRPQTNFDEFNFEVYFSGVTTPTPPITPTATPGPTATATPTPTATATATPGPTATATPTPTATATATPTPTATATPTPTPTATATPTPTATATATPTPTASPTPTATPVPTAYTYTFESCCVPSTIFEVTDIPLIEIINVGDIVYIEEMLS